MAFSRSTPGIVYRERPTLPLHAHGSTFRFVGRASEPGACGAFAHLFMGSFLSLLGTMLCGLLVYDYVSLLRRMELPALSVLGPAQEAGESQVLDPILLQALLPMALEHQSPKLNVRVMEDQLVLTLSLSSLCFRRRRD